MASYPCKICYRENYNSFQSTSTCSQKTTLPFLTVSYQGFKSGIIITRLHYYNHPVMVLPSCTLFAWHLEMSVVTPSLLHHGGKRSTSHGKLINVCKWKSYLTSSSIYLRDRCCLLTIIKHFLIFWGYTTQKIPARMWLTFQGWEGRTIIHETNSYLYE